MLIPTEPVGGIPKTAGLNGALLSTSDTPTTQGKAFSKRRSRALETRPPADVNGNR